LIVVKKPSQPQWHDDLPIYRQLMQVLVGHILDRTYPEGEMLPSVRQLASDYEINPLTVAKVYKELAREGFLDKLRGEGLVIRKGVREAILKRERSKFLKEEWPALRERMKQMGIDHRTLPDADE
jgi:GntR family transcriptional regulator